MADLLLGQRVTGASTVSDSNITMSLADENESYAIFNWLALSYFWDLFCDI